MNLEFSPQFLPFFIAIGRPYIQIIIVRCVALGSFLELVRGESIAGKKSKPA